MRTIQTHILIDSEPAAVWQVLVDRGEYSAWNPFIRRMDGELVVGEKLTVEVGPPGARTVTFRPTVTSVEPERRLAWLGRLFVPGLFDGRHSFELRPADGGRTRFVHAECFSGLLVRAGGRMLDRTADGFEQFNVALKARVEQHATAGISGGRGGTEPA